MLNPETNQDEDDNVVVTDDSDEKQLKDAEVSGSEGQGRGGQLSAGTWLWGGVTQRATTE